MDKERKLIIAGNWKMNKTVAESLDLLFSTEYQCYLDMDNLE